MSAFSCKILKHKIKNGEYLPNFVPKMLAACILVDRKCATIMPGSPVAVSALSGGGVTDLKLHLDPLLSLAPAQQPGPGATG